MAWKCSEGNIPHSQGNHPLNYMYMYLHTLACQQLNEHVHECIYVHACTTHSLHTVDAVLKARHLHKDSSTYRLHGIQVYKYISVQ